MSDKTINTRLPVKMELTIASANEAIEYWLTHVVLKERAKISKVEFMSSDNYFVIEFNRKLTPQTEDEDYE